MNAIKFLFAAYIATWVIHGVYLGSLIRRYSRLRQQLTELGKEK
jgi:CcmD family protein